MSIKKAFLCGALVGTSLAGFLLLVIWTRPFPGAVNAWLEKATFKFCPFYMLIFMNLIRSTTEVVVATLLGNAVLYGVLGILIILVYRLIRRSTGSALR